MNYYEIASKSIIEQDLLSLCNDNEGWFPYFNFDLKVIPYAIIHKDPLFQWLSSKYEYVPAILKVQPNHCYIWHKDDNRGVAINMLLTHDSKSFCVFADNINEVVFPINELKYKPLTYYLFNTQKFHTVYNFDKPRYLFSLEFKKDKTKLTFDDLLKEIKEFERGK